MAAASAPLLTRTDSPAVDALAAWHGLALTVSSALDRRDPRVPAVVAQLEDALGLPRRTAHDDRWPLVARRFARAHRVAIRAVHTADDATAVVHLADEAAAALGQTANVRAAA